MSRFLIKKVYKYIEIIAWAINVTLEFCIMGKS